MKNLKNHKNLLIKKHLPDLFSESPICATCPDFRLFLCVAQKAKNKILYLKKITGVLAITMSLNACVPNVVVHTGGRSGTFDESTAVNITADLHDCNTIVKENVNLTWDYSKFAFAKYIEIGTVGLIKAQEPKAKKIKRNCMTSLGHAVLD